MICCFQVVILKLRHQTNPVTLEFFVLVIKVDIYYEVFPRLYVLHVSPVQPRQFYI